MSGNYIKYGDQALKCSNSYGMYLNTQLQDQAVWQLQDYLHGTSLLCNLKLQFLFLNGLFFI